MTNFIPAELDRYCYWQTERESIRIKKESDVLPSPWTDDPILQEFKFCQVFREDDRTTRWFRNHIREPMRNEEDVLMATIIFRWFNLIETGRTLIDHDLLRKWNRKKAIYEITKQPKWITGAYIIKTPNGMDKVTGVAECVSHIWKARESILSRLHENLAKGESSLEATWLILRDYPYMGPFMAYEVVTDLRHTYLLENANDIMTWANAGPGAMRGLNRLTGRELDYSRKSHPWCEEMQDLFEQVKKILAPSIIFRNGANYEMREIEGGLCEFDKYSRIYKKEGRTRSVYKHNNLPIVEDLIEGESKYG
jgi:sRNA-binding regulator protein Hfq